MTARFDARRGAAAALAAIAIAGCVPVGLGSSRPLENGQARTGRLTQARKRLDFRLDLPADVVRLTLDLRAEGDANLDLDLYRGEAPGDGGRDRPFDRSHEPGGDERLVTSCENGLTGGIWTVRVSAAEDLDESAPFRLIASWRAAEPRPIETGRWVDLPMTVEDGKLANLYFDVPPGTESVHVRIGAADGDYDLRLADSGPIDTAGDDADVAAETARDLESLDLGRDDGLHPGRWWLQVLLAATEDDDFARDDTVRIAVSFGEPLAYDVPLALPPFAPIEGVAPDLAHAVAATVEIDTDLSSGTGTVVSPTGLILTNAHVLDATPEGEPQGGAIFVSFTDRPDRPPRQLYVAEPVAIDVDLDLALLRLVRTVHGDPIAAEPGLAYLPLHDRARVALGDPITVLGYPYVGGTSYRVNVTLTRGVVSGLIRQRGERALISSDATIASGNSGGAAFDRDWNLIAIPTFVVQDDIDALGFFRLVDSVPVDWRRRVAEEAP